MQLAAIEYKRTLINTDYNDHSTFQEKTPSVMKKIYKQDCSRYKDDCAEFYKSGISESIDAGSPVFLKADDDDDQSTGIVLAHGLLSAPMEVRLLAEFLYEKGYSVYCIRLPGHGTVPGNLCQVI